MDVTCTAEANLTPQQEAEILALQQAGFPEEPDFLHQRWYHTGLRDDDLWFGAQRDGRLIGNVRLVVREIRTAAGPLLVGGVANVCSHPDARGCRAAKACMLAAARYVARNMDFGLLFTTGPTRGFYASLGWREIDNPVNYEDDHGRIVSADLHGCVMICPGRRALGEWPQGKVDLNGPDW